MKIASADFDAALLEEKVVEQPLIKTFRSAARGVRQALIQIQPPSGDRRVKSTIVAAG